MSKPDDEFHSNGWRRDGSANLRSACKPCENRRKLDSKLAWTRKFVEHDGEHDESDQVKRLRKATKTLDAATKQSRAASRKNASARNDSATDDAPDFRSAPAKVRVDLQKLFDNVKAGPMEFEKLCDRMDMAPRRLRSLLETADATLPMKYVAGHVGIELPSPRDDVQDTQISPTVGEEQVVAVISDTHYGSKYCLRGAIKDFIEYAYGLGVREVLHPGDMLDGDYRHGKFEMTHMGLSEQTRDMRKNLPHKEGLTYHSITGNHDFTFTDESGVNVGKFIEDDFKAAGRDDFRSYGDRGAFIKLRGALFHLWHPSGSSAYAASYNLQKKIESYSPGEKPQILLTGHYHRCCYVFERGVHGLLCPTFQAGGSAFGKSLKSGAPAIGGLILRYSLTEEGTIRSFSVEKRSYFRKETVHHIDSEDGIEV